MDNEKSIIALEYKNISFKRKVYELLLSLLIILMMIAPLSYTVIKLFCLLLLLVVFIFSGSINYVLSKCKYRKILFIYLSYNILSMLYGCLNNAPGAFRVCTTHLLWPLLFSMLFLNYTDQRMLEVINSCIIKALYIITILDIAYLMSIYGIIPITREAFFKLNMSYMGSASDHEISASHTTTFIFGIPYIIGKFVLEKNDKEKLKYLWALLPMLLVVLLTGRRSLLLIVITCPLYGIIIWFYIKNRIILRKFHCFRYWYQIYLFLFILIFSIVVALYIAGIDIKYVINYFNQGFDFQHDESASIRRIQFYYLMKGWFDSPLMGNGLGSFTSGIIRSEKMPWSYELSYCALLFHKGIIGFAIAFGLVYSIFRLHKNKCIDNDIHFQSIFPYLLGLFAFLIAHGTNPYLTTFSNIWYLYLPLALTSYSVKKQNAKI